MRRFLILAALLSVLVVAAVTGYKFGAHGATQSVWITGFGLSGETLRLESGGTYVLQPWGDLPPYEPHIGRWYRLGNRLELVPIEPNKRTTHLRYEVIVGCEVLITQKVNVPPPSIFPSGVTGLDFYPAHTDCEKRIGAYNRAHSVAP